MECKSYLEKDSRKPCIICRESIGLHREYGYAKTKPVRSKIKSYPSKTIYFHMDCYEEECHPNN